MSTAQAILAAHRAFGPLGWTVKTESNPNEADTLARSPVRPARDGRGYEVLLSYRSADVKGAPPPRAFRHGGRGQFLALVVKGFRTKEAASAAVAEAARLLDPELYARRERQKREQAEALEHQRAVLAERTALLEALAVEAAAAGWSVERSAGALTVGSPTGGEVTQWHDARWKTRGEGWFRFVRDPCLRVEDRAAPPWVALPAQAEKRDPTTYDNGRW